MKTKLIKRNYLGEGYFHYFKNLTTNDVVQEECTRGEYERLGEKGGSKFNPIKSGHKWLHSLGGTIKVDTPTYELGDNEYTEVPVEISKSPDKVFIRIEEFKQGYFDKSEVVNDEVEITEN